ncbi:hypothetical protein E2605_18900 [Dysgonomonas capnocytophagoides]|uniref:Phage abortive infection protein n=1 Tax=Dysgonomonas capnocytophagoides TaxID=45254 RepID=A0A4Y8KTP3_9BACT|nr:putative phage abortive infection protein [Dysgonomonas capnocytophagoides]TFD92174.1 hypothetical protein E2605_18900 [Dysgonomonas capnocytophagoides]
MKSIKASNFGIGLFSCIAVVGFIATIVFFFIHLESKEVLTHPFNTAYLFGGAISGAFSCLSLLGILWTLKKQTDANEKQDKRLKKQQFETTFFNMLDLLQKIIDGLSSTLYFIEKKDKGIVSFIFNQKSKLTKDDDIIPQRIVGRETFSAIYNSCICSIDGVYNENGIKRILEKHGIDAYMDIPEILTFDHYFRYLYRIIKFVDEAKYLESNQNSIHERYKYISILRGTLSRDELLLLFYNGLFFDKLKDLMEKYALLKNIREDLTIQSLDAKEANLKADYHLLLTNSIEESDSHKPKRAKDEIIIPKYYKGAFFNEKELQKEGLRIKQ